MGAERERGDETATVEDAARRDDRHLHRVDDQRHERQRRDLSGVPARLRPLGDDDVAAGVDRTERVADLAAHVHDHHAVPMAEVDDLRRHPETGDERARALGADRLDERHHVARAGSEEVDAERLRGARLQRPDLAHHLVVVHAGRAKAAEPARLRDGGGHFRVRHAAHTREHDRVLDTKQITELSPQHAAAL